MSLELTIHGLVLAGWLLAPVLAAGFLATALANVLQTWLAWQDQTINQIARLLAVGLTWAVAGPWIFEEIRLFAALAWGPR